MITPELKVFVEGQLKAGVPKEVIQKQLESNGWLPGDVAEVFGVLSAPAPVTPMPGSASRPEPLQPMEVHPGMQSEPDMGSGTRTPKNKKIFLAVAIVLLLVLAGGGAYAYYSGAFISLSHLAAEAMDSARTAHSASYDTTAAIDLSEITEGSGGLSQLFPGVATGKMSLTTTGSYDVTDPKNSKGSASISVNLGSLSLAAEVRVLGDTLYAELTKVPTIAFFPMLSSFQNKWISFPYKRQDGQAASNPLSNALGIDTGTMSKLSPDQKDHVYQMLRSASLIKTVKRFSPEEIGGALSYHFSFDLDQAGIAAHLRSLKSYINDIGKDDSVLSSFDPTTLAKELAKIKDFKGEIWIGRQDHLPHKVTLNFGVNPDEAKPEQIKVNVVSILSDWNKPVSIAAPADSVPLETFVSGMMPISLNTKEKTGTTSAKYDTFAQCIKASGAALYGAFWAPHSQAQKNLFGSSAQYLPYVECSTQDANAQTQICRDKNITSYPTWILKNNVRLPIENSSGVTLKTLAVKTSCSLPK